MDMTSVMNGEQGVVRRNLRLDEVYEAVRHDDGGKWDMTVARRDLNWTAGKLVLPCESGEQRLAPSTWATGQLCTRLGIPTPYFRKCPSELQEAQANHWLRHGPHKPGEKWLLRAKAEQLRAVLSERYSPLDNATLLDEVRLLLPSRYRVDWFGLSDENLHLRVVDPTRCREVLPNDDLTVGIHLSNSEVGFRSVTVDALVYRLVCTNGLIRLVNGKNLLRQRHLHVSETRFAGVLAEAIDSALGESEQFLEQMATATRTPVPKITEVMESIAEKWHLSDEVQEASRRALLQENASQQESLYGLVNAYTAAAQHLPDERRYDLEVLAGHLAAHGVAAYAPRRQKRREAQDGSVLPQSPEALPHPEDSTGETAQNVSTQDVSISGPSADEQSHVGSMASESSTNIVETSIVELAREMFEAEVVLRVPSGKTMNGKTVHGRGK